MKIVAYLCSLVVTILCLALAVEFSAGLLLPDRYHGYLIKEGDQAKWTIGPYEPSESGGGFNQPIPIAKPAGTIRIVSLGASGTEGWLTAESVYKKYSLEWEDKGVSSYSRALQFILNDIAVESGQRVEVINLGIAAYNVTDVIRMLKDSLRFDPDLILLQTGGNETWTSERSRWSTYLSDDLPYLNAEITQEVISEIQGGWATQGSGDNAFSPVGLYNPNPSPVMPEPEGREESTQQRLEVYRSELARLGDYLDKLDIPAFFLVPTQNLADFHPFASMAKPGTSPEQLAELNRLLIEALQDSGPTAQAKYEAILALDDGVAEANFQLGRIHMLAGDPVKAREYLWKANNRDYLLKRLPGFFHDETRAFVANRNLPHIDVMKFYQDKSELGVVGYNWLDDDVHPNREAQFDLAVEIARSLLDADLLAASGYSGDPSRLPDFAAYNAYVGYDDEVRGDIAYLKAAHNFIAFSRFRQRLRWHPAPERFLDPIIAWLDEANEYSPSPQSLSTSAVLNFYLGRDEAAAAVLMQADCRASAERASEMNAVVLYVANTVFGFAKPELRNRLIGLLEDQGCTA